MLTTYRQRKFFMSIKCFQLKTFLMYSQFFSSILFIRTARKRLPSDILYYFPIFLNSMAVHSKERERERTWQNDFCSLFANRRNFFKNNLAIFKLRGILNALRKHILTSTHKLCLNTPLKMTESHPFSNIDAMHTPFIHFLSLTLNNFPIM